MCLWGWRRVLAFLVRKCRLSERMFSGLIESPFVSPFLQIFSVLLLSHYISSWFHSPCFRRLEKLVSLKYTSVETPDRQLFFYDRLLCPSPPVPFSGQKVFAIIRSRRSPKFLLSYAVRCFVWRGPFFRVGG